MDDRVRFETPDDVDLEFDLAGPASRMAASMVDYTIIGGIMLAAVAVLIAAGVVAVDVGTLLSPDALTELGALGVAILLFTFSVINLGYFVGCEWFLSGQTVGKRALGLRVVRDGGYAINFGASFLRNVARIVDMLPGPYFVGLIAVLLSSERKRLGDLIAGTLVVRHTKEAAPTARFAGQTYAALEHKQFALTRDHLAKLDEGAFALLDGYFDRAKKLPPSVKAKLTQDVAQGLAERMDVELVDENQEALLIETYLALREHLEASI